MASVWACRAAGLGYPAARVEDHDLAIQATLNQATGPALIGRTIAGGKYEIVGLLGEGGMGAVYQARQLAMGRMVALKLIRPEVGMTSDAVARFHKEMMITAKVEHPNTIRVYDFGEADGQLYLAMEFLAGTSLHHLIEGGRRLDVARIVRIGKQVANALGAAHERGIVHRDLKPQNIMLLDSHGERDFVKVLDFGIAKSIDDDVQLTTVGRLIGTPAFMAPEQAMGSAVDHRTDLYALGVTLYRMTCGRVPFDAQTTGSMLLAHATQPPPPVLSLAPDVPQALAGLIMQLLEKEPAARPGSAAEVVSRLERCLDRTGSDPTSATVPDRGPVPPRRRRKVLGLAIAGALVAAGGGIAYFAFARILTDDPTTTAPGPVSPPRRDTAAAAASRRAELDDVLASAEPLAPDGCRAHDPATVTRLIDAARALARDGGADQALAILGDAAGASSEAWALRSRAQLATSADNAEASAAEAVRLCPGYAVAHNLSGNALQKLGQVQPAEDAYVRALSLAPSYDAPRFNLGLLQLRRKDATAIATFTELLRRRPDHPNAHLARAQAYVMQGRNAEALADLEEAVRRQPGSAEAWATLGELREHVKQGDFKAAYCRAAELGSAPAAARCPK